MMRKKSRKENENFFSRPILGLILVAALVMFYNQVQVNGISDMLSAPTSSRIGGNVELASLDITKIKNTGQTLAAVFPMEEVETLEDAMAILLPSGTPDYGEELGVSYDDPVNGLATLSKLYAGIKQEVQTNNPEAWDRYVNMASRPVGITCEFCCGIGTIATDKNGKLRGGCAHIKALNALALYLNAYTDYNDGEILQEVMKWKTLFFPKNMIELGMTVAGGDTSTVDDLPGMVGGC